MAGTFSDDQFDLAYPPGIEAHWWTLARNHIVRRELQKVASGRTRIIEVGCGRGVVVDYLHRRGFDCMGVELAEVEPLASVRAFVRTGTDALALQEEERQGYEVLLLLDVIEHVADPEAFLAGLLSGFPNLRYLLLTVPACRELWSNYDECYGHCRRYTLEMLEEFSPRLPLAPVRSGYFFHAPYLPLRMLSLLNRNRATALRPPAKGLGWLHRLVAQGMLWDFLLVPRNLPGSSLIAVFKVDRGTL